MPMVGWRRQRLAVACAVGAAVLGTGLLIRLYLNHDLGGRAAFIFFMPAVLAAATLGGLWPGLVITAFATGAALWITAQYTLLTPGDMASTGVFVLLCIGVSLVGAWSLRTQARLGGSVAVLSERESRISSILATVPDAIIIIDAEGRIESFSPAAERQFGWTSAEALGRNVSFLMPSPYRENHDGYIERYRRTRERRIIGTGRVVVGERKDGSTFPMELSVGEIQVNNRQLFTGFVRDLTERQQSETRLQALQAELVHVSRLTSMGEMASSLAHELNQPLLAVSTYLAVAQRHVDSAADVQGPLKEAMQKATQQVLRAGEVIRRLREFVSRQETERGQESLAKLIEEASTLALIGTKQYSVRVVYEFDAAADIVTVDRIQIQQVVLNLVRNAVEAMADAPRRELMLRSARTPDGFAKVTVTDSGSGIPEEQMAQLFQPFFTTKATGMGVGLSISRTIIESHGGRIWAEPASGGGTCFAFTLPIDEDERGDGSLVLA